jgi:hypothetical protein
MPGGEQGKKSYQTTEVLFTSQLLKSRPTCKMWEEYMKGGKLHPFYTCKHKVWYIFQPGQN